MHLQVAIISLNYCVTCEFDFIITRSKSHLKTGLINKLKWSEEGVRVSIFVIVYFFAVDSKNIFLYSVRFFQVRSISSNLCICMGLTRKKLFFCTSH